MTRKSDQNFSLQAELPSGLPTECEKCGNAYDARISHTIGPCRFGRWLRKIAPPFSIIVLILLLISGAGAPSMHYAIVVIGPSILLYILGGILPIRSRLYCHKCKTSSYFKPPK